MTLEEELISVSSSLHLTFTFCFLRDDVTHEEEPVCSALELCVVPFLCYSSWKYKYVEKHPITPHCQLINTFPGVVKEEWHKTQVLSKDVLENASIT